MEELKTRPGNHVIKAGRDFNIEEGLLERRLGKYNSLKLFRKKRGANDEKSEKMWVPSCIILY